ncbi:hypothetical protein [Desulfoscipio gibsoniae]|jgi:hypothetical protein|uniref:Virulence-related protein n=1 Tax=Desulfoscipio gibsoniae DSM 7213 TaxID=767817 RepID=R4KSS4_9FIRM|nr:hypothetical protein [Desulfoscipio gibsoniae]AGL03640.1 hypothetical protein Desgi_4398 [Desulfoscipio gibsoniae DSM 7213]
MTRKELVHKLAEHLGIRPVYLAAPSFAYQVGEYTVNRQGNILDSEGQVLELEALLAGGKEEPELEIITEQKETAEANTSVETKPTALEVGIPLEGYDGRSLRNLLHMIYSKQPLIKKALNLDADLVSEEVITALNQQPMTTLEHFQNALEGKSCPGIDFDFNKGTITFKLGQGGDDPEKVEAATQLLALVNLSARRSKLNISAKVKATDNEKYTFRTWLLRLGMIGDDYRLARRVLLQNLPGNSAFRKQVQEGA